jgi:hypothetical protein
MLTGFVALTFGWFGGRFVHSIRYLVPLVPFLCVAAAYALVRLRRHSLLVWRVAAAGVVVATALYALAFTAIYRAPHTRIAASAWIERTVPAGSVIVSEHWDDALPVRPIPGRYVGRELPVFDPDDATKLRKLYDGLAGADLYVLSSPRAWRTVGRLPDRFPLMPRFYHELGAGHLGFRKAAQFTSAPRLLGVTLDDLTAEETFTVYDHPAVILYRRAEDLSWERFRDAVCGGASLPGCSR